MNIRLFRNVVMLQREVAGKVQTSPLYDPPLELVEKSAYEKLQEEKRVLVGALEKIAEREATHGGHFYCCHDDYTEEIAEEALAKVEK